MPNLWPFFLMCRVLAGKAIGFSGLVDPDQGSQHHFELLQEPSMTMLGNEGSSVL